MDPLGPTPSLLALLFDPPPVPYSVRTGDHCDRGRADDTTWDFSSEGWNDTILDALLSNVGVHPLDAMAIASASEAASELHDAIGSQNAVPAHECSAAPDMWDTTAALPNQLNAELAATRTEMVRAGPRMNAKKYYACPICPTKKLFREKFNLNKHIRNVHENLRLHRCEHCGKTFQQRCHKKQHISTCHEKKRPYKCEVCHLTFGWPTVLKRHQELRHGRQRPFTRH